MNVINWVLDRIIPYARNPRKNDGAAVDKVAASIKEFGWRQPIVVDADGVIIAGHTRYKAARKLGLAEAPVHQIGALELSATQIRAYRLADNRVGEEAEWDGEMLKLELEELALDEDFDIELTGFDTDELEAALAESAPLASDVDEDSVPEPTKEVVTQPGQMWHLGAHRLLCGSCLDAGDVDRLMDGRLLANLCFTSPPYASQRTYDASTSFRPVQPDKYVAWYEAVAATCARVLAADGSYFVNIKAHAEDGQRDLYVNDLTIAFVREWGWKFIDEFCWRKNNNGVPGIWPNRFKNAWEPVFHFARQNQIKFYPLANGIESTEAFSYDKDQAVPDTSTGSGFTAGSGRVGHAGLARPSNVVTTMTSRVDNHPAAFPVQLPAWFIRAFSEAGDLVFDPFMGSGTTLIACEIEHRVALGTEISPRYCDVIVRRWQDFTGLDATDANGVAFNVRAAQREAA